MANAVNNILDKIYHDPKHPGSFGGLRKLYVHAKKEEPGITLTEVKDWLSKQPEYTLLRDSKINFTRNKIYVSYINEQWEIDVLDVSEWSRDNRTTMKKPNKIVYRTIKYLVTIIDVFSKYAYLMPIEEKSMKEICENFEHLFKLVRPQKIRSDRGKEFDNKQFNDLCRRNKIIHFMTQNSTKKCAVVERFNRTMRDKIQHFLYFIKSRRYIDDLESLLASYNYAYHSAIKMAPSQVSLENERQVFRNLYGKKNMLEILRGKKLKPKFEVGDTVRQRYDPKVFDKGYRQKWTDIVYKVKQVINKFNQPQYILENRGHPLKRRFYADELQKVIVDENTVWDIEKILRRRVRNNRVEALVKWSGHPHEDNSWITLDSVRK